LETWLTDATKALHSVADNPRTEARRLVEFSCGWDTVQQIAEPDALLTREQFEVLSGLITRRLADEPLSRILGRREFWGLDLSIRGATLDPRADTETLVELIVETCDSTPPKTILDLGTGSGAILLALLSEMTSAQGLGIDQDSKTIETAQSNADALGLQDRARFVVSDWLSGVDTRFDLIASNPPYIPTPDLENLDRNVRDYDDPRALDGGADGLDFYRDTLKNAGRFLNNGGFLALELGIGQSEAVIEIADALGWTLRGQRNDLAGIPRALVFVAHP
jgi:release factor glutamine methyltransferase